MHFLPRSFSPGVINLRISRALPEKVFPLLSDQFPRSFCRSRDGRIPPGKNFAFTSEPFVPKPNRRVALEKKTRELSPYRDPFFFFIHFASPWFSSALVIDHFSRSPIRFNYARIRATHLTSRPSRHGPRSTCPKQSGSYSTFLAGYGPYSTRSTEDGSYSTSAVESTASYSTCPFEPVLYYSAGSAPSCFSFLAPISLKWNSIALFKPFTVYIVARTIATSALVSRKFEFNFDRRESSARIVERYVSRCTI